MKLDHLSGAGQLTEPVNPKLQMLGLLFASADLAFEITADGSVCFAVGAVEQLTGLTPQVFIGTKWEDIVTSEDRNLLAAIIGGMEPGERRRGLLVQLKPIPGAHQARSAMLSVFRLPEKGGRFSCALSLGVASMLDETRRREDGFLDVEAFRKASDSLMQEAEGAGPKLRLDLVEMPGLDKAIAAMGGVCGEQARRRVAATLRAESYGGLGGAEVSPERFALIRTADTIPDRLSTQLQAASGADIAVRTVELPLEGPSIGQNLRAMRYALCAQSVHRRRADCGGHELQGEHRTHSGRGHPL